MREEVKYLNENIEHILEQLNIINSDIGEINKNIQNLDLLPLGTILSLHPKNGEKFPDGWLECDGRKISKGPLNGTYTPGIDASYDK